MFLNTSFPYSKSLRNQLLIALILSFVVVFIIIFLQPFGSNNFSSPYKNLYFSGYGVILFITYLGCYLSFNIYYKRYKTWKWAEELLFCFLFISIGIVLAFIYTELVINKKPERITLDWFLTWFKFIFLGFGAILGALSVFLRKYYGQMENTKNSIENTFDSKENKLISLKGSLKKESFSVEIAKVIYVKSEDNYVKIYYLKDEILAEKMLRITLSGIQKQLDNVIKIHRSYLINTSYIVSLKGNSQNAKLLLKHVKNSIPVSKTYFEKVKSYIN